MNHPIAHKYDGAAEVEAQIAAREPDTTDYSTQVHRTVDTYHPKRLHLSVAEIRPETATSATFQMRARDGGLLPPFLAGQYVNLFIDGTSRPFAISSSPVHRDHYDLTVRRVPGGRVSNLLLDTLAVGDEVTTTGPMGTFYHNPLFHGDDVVFLAGGSGVAPAMSMIRDIVDNGSERRFHLIYGSRASGDVIFRAELDRIAAAHAHTRVDHVIAEPDEAWPGASGFITADVIQDLAGDPAGRMVYVCGPQAMYEFALAELALLGHPRHRIRFEANGAPADPAARASWPTGLDPAEQVTVTTRQGSFRTPRSRPLLDALEDQGISLEVACRSGECSLCRVRVLSGEVHTADEAKPRMSDAAFGYVHSCVSYPLTDVELDL